MNETNRTVFSMELTILFPFVNKHVELICSGPLQRIAWPIGFWGWGPSCSRTEWAV